MALTLLITGTDTEVGKTFVAVGLIRAMARLGLRVAPFKPVETGCLKDSSTGALIPSDARLLESASGTSAKLATICPYRFALPAAPLVAAEKEQRPVNIAILDDALNQLQSEHDVVLIETAGGLLVPVAGGVDFAVLAKRWNVPVLVVAGSRLGVLNQTLLTMGCLQNQAISLAGVVLNHPYGDGSSSTLGELHRPALDTNSAILRRLISCEFWEVPYTGSQSSSSFDSLFDRITDDLIGSLRREKA